MLWHVTTYCNSKWPVVLQYCISWCAMVRNHMTLNERVIDMLTCSYTFRTTIQQVPTCTTNRVSISSRHGFVPRVRCGKIRLITWGGRRLSGRERQIELQRSMCAIIRSVAAHSASGRDAVSGLSCCRLTQASARAGVSLRQGRQGVIFPAVCCCLPRPPPSTRWARPLYPPSWWGHFSIFHTPSLLL